MITQFILFFTLILIAHGFSKVTTIGLNDSNDVNLNEILAHNPGLIKLGAVKHITYFMENSTKRTWSEAKSFAISVNMELAEFWASVESDFFKNVSFSLLPIDGYWTGGRDSKRQSQYKWDSTGANFSSFTIDFYYDTPVRSCILLGYSNNHRVMHDDSCDAKWYTILQFE